MHRLISILGPTATGKTSVAAALASVIEGEVISADSRQVYRGMDIGTGKDLSDYEVTGKKIPYHLIDIAEPGEEYNVFRFQKDFLAAFRDIVGRNKQAIMCGGTGMYLESVILGYDMIVAPKNRELRKELAGLSDRELEARLRALKTVHNVTDTKDRERMIRAIEISLSPDPFSPGQHFFGTLNHHVFGIELPRQEMKRRITERLACRLEEGMVEEIRELLDSGIKAEQLEFYGLEYKYLTCYVTGKITYEEMFGMLNTAIHQFSKRQMTWFRRMEKKGVRIKWIDGRSPTDEKVSIIMEKLKNENR